MALHTECCYAEWHLCWMSFVLSVSNEPFMLRYIMVSVVMQKVVVPIPTLFWIFQRRLCKCQPFYCSFFCYWKHFSTKNNGNITVRWIGSSSSHFSGWQSRPWGSLLSEDPTVWLDGARPPPVSCIVPALAWKWAWQSHYSTNLLPTKITKNPPSIWTRQLILFFLLF